MSASTPENPDFRSPDADGTTSESADARMARLSAKARGLARVPGVYLMKDAAGVVLYVGKASVLPNRVSTYFQASTDLGHRKSRMLELIEDFDVVECEGEWEALLLESRLVKDIRPRFNERLVDDKTFPYLAVTLKDEFPGVFLTRTPADAAIVNGPFLKSISRPSFERVPSGKNTK